MANPKPKKLKTSDINAILIGTIVVSILVVFSVIVFFDSTTSGIIKKIGLFVVCWLLVFFSTIAIKAGALSGDRELNNKDWADATLSSFISSILIVGSTLMVAETTIVGRAFENTVGLQLINFFKKGDKKLTESLKQICKQSDGIAELNPELNIDLIFTQMFSPKTEFDNYIENFNTQKPFSNVAIIQDTEKTNAFYENFVIRKNDISTAALASLATTAAILTCYKPIISPWINV
jgi:hypothetical protein